MLSARAREEILKIKVRYPHPRSATLPSLYVAQGDQGWLSPETLDEVANLLELPKRMLAFIAAVCARHCWQASRRHLIEHARRQVSVQGERKAARNRCRGHHEKMGRNSVGLVREAQALPHPKAMLLIHDDQAQPCKAHAFGE